MNEALFYILCIFFDFLTESIAKTVVAGLKINNKEWRKEFEVLTNPKTQTFADEIKDSVRITA